MNMKRTDLEKNMAKRLDGKLKSQAIPQRFAGGSAKAASASAAAPASTTPAAKLVAVSCRLPAALAGQLRQRALTHEGGISALMAAALEQYLGAPQKS